MPDKITLVRYTGSTNGDNMIPEEPGGEPSGSDTTAPSGGSDTTDPSGGSGESGGTSTQPDEGGSGDIGE